jgi:hypothetical protein
MGWFGDGDTSDMDHHLFVSVCLSVHLSFFLSLFHPQWFYLSQDLTMMATLLWAGLGMETPAIWIII